MKFIKDFFNEIKSSLVNFSEYKNYQNLPFGLHAKYLYELFYLTALIAILPFLFAILSSLPKIPGLLASGKSILSKAYPEKLVLTIKNNQLSTNVNEPYTYNLPFETERPGGKHDVIINTKATIEDYKNCNCFVLATKNAVIYPKKVEAKGGGITQQEVLFYKDLEDQTFDVNKYKEMISLIDPYLKYVQPFIVIFAILLFLVGPIIGAGTEIVFHLVYLAIFSLLASLVLWIAKPGKFSYQQTFKMLIRASTLPIVFFAVLNLLNLSPHIPFGYSLLLAVFFGTIVFRHES